MSASSEEDALDLEAARLALLALAGMVPGYEPVDADRVRVAPDAAVLTRDKAAKLLASMPKPLICHAEIAGRILVVRCELLAEAGRHEQDRFAQRRALFDGVEGVFGDSVDDEGHLVRAFARDESELLSLAGARRWFRDYDISRVTWSIDSVDNEFAGESPKYVEAKRLGAKSVMLFTSAGGHIATMDGEHFPFPLPATATAEERRKVERTFIALAKQFLFEMEDEDELAAVERDLVERGEIPADSVEAHSMSGAAFVHAQFSSQMRKFFEGREMPAECAAFVEACRGAELD